jgi:hypothetical protein
LQVALTRSGGAFRFVIFSALRFSAIVLDHLFLNCGGGPGLVARTTRGETSFCIAIFSAIRAHHLDGQARGRRRRRAAAAADKMSSRSAAASCKVGGGFKQGVRRLQARLKQSLSNLSAGNLARKAIIALIYFIPRSSHCHSLSIR